ncbi:MAG: Y-family DNA polymerase [Synergistaceae bacterium]|nr:Y-family DNA polymerase [Synergistaceae bacterium]
MKNLLERSIGLCDCNNFFVSCERRENPSLLSRPVVVLSGNDGCVVSRSNEAKALGVGMGEPYFKVRGLLERAGAAVLSGRLSLYNKISSEVMGRLSRFSDLMEVYSIDEAFFNLAIASVEDPAAYCREIREDIWRSCGIPVSIGISSTKTLAKLASHCAKMSADGVFWIDSSCAGDAEWMAAFPLEEVWGIGRRMAARLRSSYRIKNTADFMMADDLWLKKNFSVNALYTAWELRGYSVYPLSEKHGAPSSIQVSRSFGDAVSSYEELLDAVSYFTLCAARQLRGARQAASRMGLYIRTNPFRRENFYFGEDEYIFSVPKSLDADFLYAARSMLQKIFREGALYKKAGVRLSGFSDVSFGRQRLLFDEDGEPEGERNGRLRAAAAVADALNLEFGKVVIASADNFAAPERTPRWYPQRAHSAAAEEARRRPPLPLGPKRRVSF